MRPGPFWRMSAAHRLVELLHRGAGGDYEVQLKSGARLRVSRPHHEVLERWLGLAR
jgi:hypothetical protein